LFFPFLIDSFLLPFFAFQFTVDGSAAEEKIKRRDRYCRDGNIGVKTKLNERIVVDLD
jgi:hypothetical protein